jgi:hypothetical protein
MQFLNCKITLSFSNQKIKDRSETLINKGKYEVKIKFIVSLINLKLEPGCLKDREEIELRRVFAAGEIVDIFEDFEHCQEIHNY